MLASLLTTKYLYLFVVVFLAYFIKSITGFGNTLVMGPLFSFVMPNRITTPVDLIMSIPTNSYLAWRERKHISLKIAIPLSIMLIVGIIPGTFFLKIGTDWVLKTILGFVVIAMAIEILLRKESNGSKGNRIALLVNGIVAGILAGIFGIGALVTVYINKTTENKKQFRSNVCFVFLIENLFRLCIYIATGILNKEALILALQLAPAVLLGMFCGGIADKFINDALMKRITIILLIASGTLLVITNLFFH